MCQLIFFYLQAYLGISDEEFATYRMSLVTNGRVRYLEKTKCLKLRNFVCLDQSPESEAQLAKPYIGLQHFDSTRIPEDENLENNSSVVQ